MIANVRLSAARVLLAVDRGNTTLSAELEQPRGELVDARDRGLLLELTSGVLRWRAALDAVIAMASGRSVRDVDARALVVLRLGVYQLRHLDRIPAHAIVHESVEVVRALGAPRAAGFVNAVLRSVQRRGATLKLPVRPDAHATREKHERYLATTMAHPLWLVRRWLDRYGFDAAATWCEFNNTPPEITVRAAGRLSPAELLDALVAAGIDARVSPRVPDALRLSAGELGKMPPHLLGECRVQDDGAQLVARMAQVRSGESVVDLCASPGGKALLCADDMGLGSTCAAEPQDASSRVIAADFRPSRVAVLAAAVRASGRPIHVVRLDARQPLPFGQIFDAVLADVPCSGLGTLRRDPDIKWRRQADDLAGLASEAGQILHQASRVVRPGGRLIYATCSSEPEENEDVVRAFLATAPDFERQAGTLCTTPFADDLDAFFAVVLVRRQTA